MWRQRFTFACKSFWLPSRELHMMSQTWSKNGKWELRRHTIHREYVSTWLYSKISERRALIFLSRQRLHEAVMTSDTGFPNRTRLYGPTELPRSIRLRLLSEVILTDIVILRCLSVVVICRPSAGHSLKHWVPYITVFPVCVY